MSFDVAMRKAALVVAHPGHELRVIGWLQRARPVVFVLTDGSGSNGHSRLSSTERVLRTVGAHAGSIFGRMSDREIYMNLLQRKVDVFLTLADELAAALVACNVDYVVGDAREGYNPSHDVCRLIIDAAVCRARQDANRHIDNFDFPLVGPADAHRAGDAEPALPVTLDDEGLARKIDLARSYIEMTGEVEGAIAAYGVEGFRTEWLRVVPSHGDTEQMETPFYEQHGAKRVAEGVYSEVVRYADHVQPVARSLREWVVSSHRV